MSEPDAKEISVLLKRYVATIKKTKSKFGIEEEKRGHTYLFLNN